MMASMSTGTDTAPDTEQYGGYIVDYEKVSPQDRYGNNPLPPLVEPVRIDQSEGPPIYQLVPTDPKMLSRRHHDLQDGPTPERLIQGQYEMIEKRVEAGFWIWFSHDASGPRYIPHLWQTLVLDVMRILEDSVTCEDLVTCMEEARIGPGNASPSQLLLVNQEVIDADSGPPWPSVKGDRLDVTLDSSPFKLPGFAQDLLNVLEGGEQPCVTILAGLAPAFVGTLAVAANEPPIGYGERKTGLRWDGFVLTPRRWRGKRRPFDYRQGCRLVGRVSGRHYRGFGFRWGCKAWLCRT